MLIGQALTEARARLIRAGIDSAGLDAAVLLSHLTRLPRASLIARDDRTLDPAVERAYFALIARRARSEPCAYLTGWKDFYSLRLKVTDAVLIPRPESELLVEAAAAYQPESVLDLGTGSGALILAVKSLLPRARCLGTDLSPAALEVARENARSLGLDVEFLRSRWFEDLPARRWDLILSNPPYVAAGDPHLERCGLNYEPRGALVSGADGLKDIRILISGAPAFLAPGGRLLLEHGWDQGERVRDLFGKRGYTRVRTLRDLGGRERVTLGQI